MGILSGLKNLLGQINEIDSSIYSKSRDFADVYAKNIELEEEIAARTKELEQANQTILTLNSVWDMMNSSQPLSNMLEKIVNILHEDLDYTFAVILKIEKDENGNKYFSVKADSGNRSIAQALSFINETMETYRLPYITNSIAVKSVLENKILSTPDMTGMLRMFFPRLTEEQLKEVMSGINSKSCTIIPLKYSNDKFGTMIVTSQRDNVTDTEMNFLSLYANQVELAITVAGLFEEVKKQAITDPLTGLYNRRYFEENIIKEAERSLRLKQPFSLIALDLDYLKRINDTYGHQYGDIAIKTIGNVLKKEARSIDIPSRIGGEEFELLLPGVDSKGALIAAERIRKSIENQVIDTIGGITASIGVATFLEHSDRIDELTELADQAMYKAKISGRNQVRIAQKIDSTSWQQTAIETFMDIISKRRISIDDSTMNTINLKLEKLKSNVSNENSVDAIYSVVDLISQTYNQSYKAGTTKSKLYLAEMIAKRIDLQPDEINKLRLALMLYDIGNLMIPNAILNKKEPLTEEEKNIIHTHPLLAAREILKPISNIQEVIPIIENHHENWDGSGYPEKKSGIEIPISSQIILLVDAFYAMTQDRPYRQAYDIDKIIDIIKSEADKRWSKKLVEDFIYVVKNESLF